MTTLTYTLLFAGVLCVGACLGFLLACLLKSGDQECEIVNRQLQLENSHLQTEISYLREENSAMKGRLEKIFKLVERYFGPIPQ